MRDVISQLKRLQEAGEKNKESIKKLREAVAEHSGLDVSNWSRQSLLDYAEKVRIEMEKS